jgi:hypothetical protein
MIFKIAGKLLDGQDYKRYVEATTSKEAVDLVQDELFVSSWTVLTYDTEPEDSTFACPHCGERLRNPALWILS